MYNAFFGFTQSPFYAAPEPPLFYPGAQHQEALRALIHGVQCRKGWMLLTGAAGSGKTTVLSCLRDFLFSRQGAVATLPSPPETAEQLYASLIREFDLPEHRGSKTESVLALRGLLQERAADNRDTTLIVDEAHRIEIHVWEELLLLGGIEDRRGELLQIVLAGEPGFEFPPGLRIPVSRTLTGFGLSETSDYIDARLTRAGMTNQTVFSSDIIREIHTRSRGIPGLINTICDQVLLTAFSLETRVATMAILDEVSDALGGEIPSRG